MSVIEATGWIMWSLLPLSVGALVVVSYKLADAERGRMDYVGRYDLWRGAAERERMIAIEAESIMDCMSQRHARVVRSYRAQVGHLRRRLREAGTQE